MNLLHLSCETIHDFPTFIESKVYTKPRPFSQQNARVLGFNITNRDFIAVTQRELPLS